MPKGKSLKGGAVPLFLAVSQTKPPNHQKEKCVIGGNANMGCEGKVYRSKRWAKRFGKGRKIRKVKGGYRIGKKKRRRR